MKTVGTWLEGISASQLVARVDSFDTNICLLRLTTKCTQKGDRHYCRLGDWGKPAKIAEIQGILGAHEEHMCTDVLTHFPIYTETHLRNSSVCVLVSFPSTSPFKWYIYIHLYICMNMHIGTYALTVLYIHVFYVWHWYISQNVSLLDLEHLLLSGRDSSGHQCSATAACGVPLSPNSTQGTAMLPCFSVFKYEKSPQFLLGLGWAASHHLGNLKIESII